MVVKKVACRMALKFKEAAESESMKESKSVLREMGAPGDANANEAKYGQQRAADHETGAPQHEAPGKGHTIFFQAHPHGASVYSWI